MQSLTQESGVHGWLLVSPYRTRFQRRGFHRTLWPALPSDALLQTMFIHNQMVIRLAALARGLHAFVALVCLSVPTRQNKWDKKTSKETMQRDLGLLVHSTTHPCFKPLFCCACVCARMCLSVSGRQARCLRAGESEHMQTLCRDI
jgi:hypothetical protein